MTRPKAQSASFADMVVAAWNGPLTVVHSPLIEIVWIDTPPSAGEVLIFTSVNGVAAAKRMTLPKGRPAWCVGDKTAKAARNAGFAPKTGPGDADGLVADIIAANPRVRLAHIRGMHTRGDVSARLAAAGVNCDDVIAYDQRALTLNAAAKSALAGKSPVIVPLFSPRTGVIFAQQGPYQAKVYAPVISEAVKDALEPSLVARVDLANRPDANAMLDATLAALGAATAST